MRTNKNVALSSSREFFNEELLPWLNALPQFEHMGKPGGESEYYGASSVIAKRLGLAKPLPTKARWLHGWTHRRIGSHLLLTGDADRATPFLVSQAYEEKVLRNAGFQNISRVGVPYIYCQPEFQPEKFRNSLLVCPGHTTNFSIPSWDRFEDEYAEYIQSLTERFTNTVVCLNANCIESGIWIRELDKRKIPWVLGASIFDRNAYTRMRQIFSSFEYMTTNAIGSHVLYSALEGSKVSICNWKKLYSKESASGEPLYKSHPELLELIDETESEAWIQKNFPHLWLSDPLEATDQTAWAKKEAGTDKMQSPEAIAQLLGWRSEAISKRRWASGAIGPTAEGTAEATVFMQMLRTRFAIDCGETEMASEWIRELKALRLDDPQVDLLRIRLFLRTNQNRSALEAAREAARRFPKNEDIHYYLQATEEICPPEPCPVVRPGDEDFREMYAKVRSTTMLSGQRLYNLYRMAKKACIENIEGNFAECGVAGGGGTLLLALVIKRYSSQERKVFAFDTFEGMPEPNALDVTDTGMSADECDWSVGTCSASLEFVAESMRVNGVGDIVECVPGLFEDMLEMASPRIGTLALLHADGDWYESIKVTLHALYDIVEEGGFVQIDDYGFWKGCAQAVDEFFADRKLTYPLEKIDKEGVWFRKAEESFSLRLPRKADPGGVQLVQSTQPDKTKVPTALNPNERYQIYSVLSQTLPKGRSHVLVDLCAFAGSNLILMHQAMQSLQQRALVVGVESQNIPVLRAVQQKLGEKKCRILRAERAEALARLETSLSSETVRPDFILIHLPDQTYEDFDNLLRVSRLLIPGGVLAIQDFSGEGIPPNVFSTPPDLESLDIPCLDREGRVGADRLDSLPAKAPSRLMFYRKSTTTESPEGPLDQH